MTSEFKKQQTFEELVDEVRELVDEFKLLSVKVDENFILFLAALEAIELKIGKEKK